MKYIFNIFTVFYINKVLALCKEYNQDTTNSYYICSDGDFICNKKLYKEYLICKNIDGY